MQTIESELRARHRVDAKPLRVLLLESDRLMRALVAEWLQMAGHTVQAIENDASHSPRGYDRVLVDVPAPLKAARRIIARLKAAAAGTKVIAMSAGVPVRGTSGARTLAHELGAAAVLVKPFSQEVLLDTIEQP
jgi:DNA-binding response OmpR family regulator